MAASGTITTDNGENSIEWGTEPAVDPNSKGQQQPYVKVNWKAPPPTQVPPWKGKPPFKIVPKVPRPKILPLSGDSGWQIGKPPSKGPPPDPGPPWIDEAGGAGIVIKVNDNCTIEIWVVLYPNGQKGAGSSFGPITIAGKDSTKEKKKELHDFFTKLKAEAPPKHVLKTVYNVRMTAPGEARAEIMLDRQPVGESSVVEPDEADAAAAASAAEVPPAAGKRRSAAPTTQRRGSNG